MSTSVYNHNIQILITFNILYMKFIVLLESMLALTPQTSYMCILVLQTMQVWLTAQYTHSSLPSTSQKGLCTGYKRTEIHLQKTPYQYTWDSIKGHFSSIGKVKSHWFSGNRPKQIRGLMKVVHKVFTVSVTTGHIT